MPDSPRGDIGGTSRCPSVSARDVSPAGVLVRKTAGPTSPDNHLTAGPYCRVPVAISWRVASVGSCPAVCAGAVSTAGVKILRAIIPAPHNHFGAGPN